MAPLCPRYFFRLLLPGVLGFSSVHHEHCPTTNFLIVYFRWQEGVPTSILGSQPIIWLLSSSPWSCDFLGLLDVTQVPFFFHQVTKYKHLFFPSDLDLLLWDWPTFFHVLTAILWWLATVNSRTGNSSNLISIFSVGHRVTIVKNSAGARWLGRLYQWNKSFPWYQQNFRDTNYKGRSCSRQSENTCTLTDLHS